MSSAFGVSATRLPAESRLHDRMAPGDFLDCYVVSSDLSPRRAADIITDFPGWARLLLHVRRILTAPFGLSNDGPAAKDKVGIFPVESESDHELMHLSIGEDWNGSNRFRIRLIDNRAIHFTFFLMLLSKNPENFNRF